MRSRAACIYALYQSAFLVLASFSVTPAHALEENYVSMETRPGVTQAFMLIEPTEPVASLILFAGGSGNIGVSPSGISRKNNFLVRTRQMFADQGFTVATVDAASDFLKRDGLWGVRHGKKHAQDIKRVIDYLRQKAPVPVWVVGTSRGTISAANAAARIERGGPDGVVLTASVTGISKQHPHNVYSAKLRTIRLPVLIVHHKSDQCRVTPYSSAKTIKKKLKSAAKVELLGFSGGKDPRGRECGALHYHGFIGIESDVVKAITAWIKQNN